ncbi:WGR domain-containing protein [Nisaea sp.]|uniref:WGR domain-containing protein n=1 Tax=Nisaea sp. TaxID=2024842 RepID=UPI003A5C74A1
MLSLVYLRLRLIDSEQNRNRVYELEIDHDLFGVITVTARFGRHGSKLRDVVSVARNLDEANRIATCALRRRLSARRRLGSAYVLTMVDGECAPLVSHWQKSGGADRRGAVISRIKQRKPYVAPVELPLFAA